MANKLYEEAHIQSIANAIREKNGSTDTYDVSEMSTAIKSISTGTTEENRLVLTGVITETTVGSGKYVVLAKSSKLAEIRNNADLFIRVELDVTPAAYTLIKTWASNKQYYMPRGTTQYQQVLRYDGSSAIGEQQIAYTINDITSNTTGTGRLYIAEDGELRMYSNSTANYAIRPCNYTVIVEW